MVAAATASPAAVEEAAEGTGLPDLLCKELEGNIFDFGERSSADLMRTTYIKIAHHVGIKYGGDVMKELETKTDFIVPPAIYPASATARQPAWDAKVLFKQNNRLDILRCKKQRLQAEI